ncbi:MAG: hypothetical protein JWM95_2808 [Gemmatimonadetes bacterium]|nr:hypothetical protein [Gemmatimonadota bacterium]
MRGAAADRLVRETLRLRSAVLPVLARVELSPDEYHRLVTAPVRAWRLLLAAECCALPLGAQLRQAGLDEVLARDVRDTISGAELGETQRVLAARATLQVIDGIAHVTGIRLLILKGGARIASTHGGSFDVGDVDVLVPQPDATRFLNALTERGWVTDGDIDVDKGVKLEPRDGALKIDLHRSLHYAEELGDAVLASRRPLAGFRMLDRATGATTFISTLRHSVVEHRHRRGHLRDLMLLAAELGDGGDALLAEVRAMIGDTGYAPELREMLDQAQAIHAGAPVRDSAHLRTFVVNKYEYAMERTSMFVTLPGWTIVALERPALRGAAYLELMRPGFAPLPHDSVFRQPWMERSVPAAGRVLARFLRMGAYVATVAVIAFTGWYIRWRAQRLAWKDGGAERRRTGGSPRFE